MTTIKLNPAAELKPNIPGDRQPGLGSLMLLHNARWFVRVRWFVIGVFLAAGLTAVCCPDLFTLVGMAAPHLWPFYVAAYLTAMNIWFVNRLTKMSDEVVPRIVSVNIMRQIFADLLAVTATVHFVGSIDTFAPFIYLFHIAMACIFFPKQKSLMVSITAAIMYGGCVLAESLHLLPHSSILAKDYTKSDMYTEGMAVAFAASAMFIWFVVWYFVATLSQAVRDRQRELREANELLKQADREMNQRVLRTTHDLKAPFTGIETNIELLQVSYWDQIPDEVKKLIERIQLRARTLSERIKAILLLGNLRAADNTANLHAETDLSILFESVLDETQDRAAERSITVNSSIPKFKVVGNSGQYAILFNNIVANAIFYSHEGGTVEITARDIDSRSVTVSVSDHGIGIRADAMDRIFEEYYRTSEAASFNKLSSGLGLTIVKEVATRLSLKISVSSEEGKGTTFEITMPKAPDAVAEKEN